MMALPAGVCEHRNKVLAIAEIYSGNGYAKYQYQVLLWALPGFYQRTDVKRCINNHLFFQWHVEIKYFFSFCRNIDANTFFMRVVIEVSNNCFQPVEHGFCDGVRKLCYQLLFCFLLD